MAKLRCQLCKTFLSLTIAWMISHLVRVHKDDPDVHLQCDVHGCRATFASVYGYKSHLRRSHKNYNLTYPQRDNFLATESANEDDEEGQNDSDDQLNDEIDHNECNMYDALEDRVEADKRLNARYLLKTREANLLTQKALDNIVEGSTELVRNTVDQIRQGLQNRLDSAGIRFDEVPGLQYLFSENHAISNPFRHVSTKHKQVEYYKQNFGLVAPRRVTLGHCSKQRRAGTKQKEVLVPDEFMYIPLLESLGKFLNQGSIIDEIRNCHRRSDENIEDFCDGQLFKTHPLFSKDATALQLMLYYDEVEIVNPLGTKAGKHKLGCFYYTLGNISPKYRSQLKAIQLLAVATSPIIKKYGIDTVLEPFMEDLEKLEQDAGHQFMIRGEPTSLAGTITFFSGDNLGSQLVGGFKEGSNANLKCRHCMGDLNAVTTKFSDKKFQARTRAGHEHQCRQIERDAKYSKTFGVCRRSILCNSRYYHVIDGMPGDAMHDVLEGVLQYGCKELLKVCINDKKYFTLEILNLRIKKFDYGYYHDGDKPSTISHQTLRNDTNSVKQKAVQMWNLGKSIPLLLGNTVPPEDDHWQHFLTLLQIVDLVFAPAISIDDLDVLEGLIEEYLWNFRELYPGKSIIPKMHYLVHYPVHIYKFGPMVRTWCMRYEAKHHFFKKVASTLGNFTNVAYSMAERHQTQQCYYMSQERGEFLEKQTVIGSGSQTIAGDTVYFDALQEQDRSIKDTDILYETKKVAIHGTEFRLGAVVLVGFGNDDLPKFALIKKMIVSPLNQCFFWLEKLSTLEFSSHFHAYEVQVNVNAESVLMIQEELKSYLPTYINKSFGSVNRLKKTYVIQRYSYVK